MCSVLVTGIGGNVGQGILRNIQNSGLPVNIIGCNVIGLSSGNHLASKVYQIPYANHPDYISEIIRIIEQEDIKLIIPSTDFESYHLAVERKKLRCHVAASDENVCKAYLDKHETFLRHTEFNIPFVDTVLLEDGIPSEWDDVIIKPKQGRGSRGIQINPKNPSDYFGQGYVAQRYIEGEEITTAFYVTKSGQVHGQITLVRELENGATVFCEVVSDYDEKLRPIIGGMVKAGGLRGSVNIQSRVNNQGEVFPFEVNCRISGTNSIRSQFGFQDVKYLLQEYLLDISPDPCRITKGKALRILMDVIYPEVTATGTAINSSTPHYLY
ncbi:MAG: ATP-grasp domain-containing protein [Flavobacteriales bacterium]|nr:ATP-grasp domain-containing protein [Flavobacteriales bacterium]